MLMLGHSLLKTEGKLGNLAGLVSCNLFGINNQTKEIIDLKKKLNLNMCFLAFFKVFFFFSRGMNCVCVCVCVYRKTINMTVNPWMNKLLTNLLGLCCCGFLRRV